MSEAANFRPKLAFDTNEPEFVRGFEAGRLWGYLQDNPDLAVDACMHASNVEMALRIGEAEDREVMSKDLDDNWLMVVFGPRGKSLSEIDPQNIRSI